MGNVLHPIFGVPKKKRKGYRAGKHALIAVISQAEYDAVKAACIALGKREHTFLTDALKHYLRVHKRLKKPD